MRQFICTGDYEEFMGNRCALFFDVDGTIMGKQGFVPESAVEAIRQARRNGHYVFINSGRVIPLARYIERYVECDGLLCGCGTDLYIGDKNIYSFELSKELLRAVQDECKKDRGDLVLEGPLGCAFAPWLRIKEDFWMLDFVKRQGALWEKDFYDESYRANKFCMQYDEETDISSFEAFVKGPFDAIKRRGSFFECVPKGHGKAFAIKKVMEALDIPMDRVYMFGDSTNDLDAIRFVDHAVIMGRHDAELEPYSEFITKDLEADGIEYALKHYELI